MKCNGSKCFGARLRTATAPMTCSQKRTDRDTRECRGNAVAFCPKCGGTHCPKHVPSVNFYDRTIKSP